MTTEDIRNDLLEMRDLQYKSFHEKLIPNVDPCTVIGVRTPLLRKYTKKVYNELEMAGFLSELPHRYYEENNVHAFYIGEIKNYQRCVEELDVFLPYVDNWATCDMLRPKCFKNHLSELILDIDRWLYSSDVYAVRFGIEMLMVHYLEDPFDHLFLEKVASIRNDEYYIKMMIAWYFATALAKQYEETIRILEEHKLAVWEHNKTIQKAVESYRITPEQKRYLKSLRRKL